MKNFIGSMLALLIVSFAISATAQQMTWTTKSNEAKDIAFDGAHHMMNAEFAQAYDDFMTSVKLDPDFTVPLVFLANLTTGDTRKSYAAKALSSAANKTEGEKLFASIVDSTLTREQRQEVWNKLHSMFPDGAMLGHFYVVTRPTADERLAAAQEYIKKFPDEAGMYNTIAYFYMQDKKDNTMAKQYLDKYLAMYPDGCNPYDSMGEYYLNVGDNDNSEKYYKLALEKYPFNISSLEALEKIEAAKKK